MPVPEREQDTGTVMLISSTMSSAETVDDERSIPESTVILTKLNEPTRLRLVVVIILFVVLLIWSFHWFIVDNLISPRYILLRI